MSDRGKNVLTIVLFAVFLALCSIRCKGSEIKLAWDASPSAGVTNYLLLAHTNSFPLTNYSAATVRVNLGTNLTCTVKDLQTGRWYFWVAAMADGQASDPSNVVQAESATAPVNMRTITVQYGATLESMTNNVFFKLKVP